MSKIISYIEEATDELVNKVSWPTWEELQNSAVVVLVASVIIALAIFVLDSTFSYVMKFIYSLFV
jgi:preprotein translocase subunit SecE